MRFVRAHSAGHPWPAGDTLTQTRSVPLKHEQGGANDHVAPKRRPPLPLWSEMVVLATPSPAKMRGRSDLGAAAGKRGASRKPPRNPPIKAVWTGPGGRDPNQRTPSEARPLFARLFEPLLVLGRPAEAFEKLARVVLIAKVLGESTFAERHFGLAAVGQGCLDNDRLSCPFGGETRA